MIPTGIRKLLFYIAAFLGLVALLKLGLRSSSTDYRSAKHWSTLINEPRLQLLGLIHVLKTYEDNALPEVEDGALLTPHALGVREAVSPLQWSQLVMATQRDAPLVVFSKSYCPYSRAAKALIEKYDIHPQPYIIEADLRNDTLRIKAYLTRLTGRSTFPNIILNGQSIGGSDDLHEYHSHQELRQMLEAGGLSVNGGIET